MIKYLFTFDVQIIPQSVCSRYGLAIGSTVAPFVRVLVWICFPVAYPISKVDIENLSCLNLLHCCSKWFNIYAECDFQLLDFLLGHGRVALFRRAELKTLVNLHGNEVYMWVLYLSNLVLFILVRI